MTETNQDNGTSSREADRYPRLQARLQDQLAFVNNLLITLAVAVLAFAASASGDSTKLHALAWRRWLFASALLLLAASLLTGVALAIIRLQSFRVTAQMARIQELSEKPRIDHQWARDRLRARSIFFTGWGRLALSSHSKRRAVAKSADRLRVHLEDHDSKVDSATIANFTRGLREDLRKWSTAADLWAWRLLWYQTGAFTAAAAALLIVPLSYYL